MVGVYIACAFVLGLAARAFGMPPLVGFPRGGIRPRRGRTRRTRRSRGHRARRCAAHAVHGGDEGAPAQHRARRSLGHRAPPSRGIYHPARHPHRVRARHRLGRRVACRVCPRVLQHGGGGEVARRKTRASRVPRPRRDRDPHRAGSGRHRGPRPVAGYGAVTVGRCAARAAAGEAPRPPGFSKSPATGRSSSFSASASRSQAASASRRSD